MLEFLNAGRLIGLTHYSDSQTFNTAKLAGLMHTKTLNIAKLARLANLMGFLDGQTLNATRPSYTN